MEPCIKPAESSPAPASRPPHLLLRPHALGRDWRGEAAEKGHDEPSRGGGSAGRGDSGSNKPPPKLQCLSVWGILGG